MKKILRIYVNHFGSATAFYEKGLFELTDPDTAEPVDTVFNLENGGGKTTLMSFIFSCFDPSENRWIQHLRKSDRRFNEYFTDDGKPAVIMIEWLMPGRSAGDPDYRLVMGQIVALVDAKERGLRADRHFFVFESIDGLTFEDVPVPGSANMSPVRRAGELVDWLQAQVRPHEVYITKVQSDWIAHLTDRRNIDTELLQRQVEFNSAEGGMDEGFLKFRTEEEFLRLFLGLTLPPRHCVSVRKTVSEAVEQQRNRPRLVKQALAMQKLKTAASPLLVSAANLLAAEKKCQAAQVAAASMRATLEERRDESEASAVSLEAEQITHEASEQNAKKLQEERQRDVYAMKGLQLERKKTKAAALHESLRLKLAAARRRLSELRGAKVYWEGEAAHDVAEQLDAQIKLEEQGLSVFRDTANQDGAVLHVVLLRQNKALLLAAAKAEDAARAAGTLMSNLRGEEKATKGKQDEARSKKAAADATIESFERERDGLIQDGVLLESDASAADAIERWTRERDEQGDRINTLQAQVGEWSAQAKVADREARQAANTASDKKLEAQTPRRVYEAGIELAQQITADAQVQRVVESNVVDPDAPGLLLGLEQHLKAYEESEARLIVERSQIDADWQSIESTRLSGRDSDIDLVVRQFVDAGVQSARPANIYLAEIQPNVSVARDLMLSDPARHLGVTVAEADWDRAAAAVPLLRTRPNRPVVVGINTRSLVPDRPGVITIAPANDSRFNFAAAQQFKEQVETRRAENAHQVADCRQGTKESQTAIDRVARYRSEFGRERIEAQRLEAERLEQESSDAWARQQSFLDQANRLQEMARVQRDVVTVAVGVHATAMETLKRVTRFRDQREVPQAGARRQQAEAAEAIVAYAEMLDGFVQRIQDAQTEQGEKSQAAKNLRDSARNLDLEAAGIAYREAPAGIAQALEGRTDSLDTLRERYTSSRDVLLSNERDRLGVASANRDNARAECVKIRQRFAKEFPDVERERCIELQGTDFDSEIDVYAPTIPSIETEYETAGKRETEAATTLKNFWETKDPKDRRSPLPDWVEALDENLEVILKEAEEGVQMWAGQYEQAREGAKRAREESARYRRAAELYQSALKQLRAGVDTEGVPQGEPVKLKSSDHPEEQVELYVADFRTADAARGKCNRTAQSDFNAYIAAAKEPSVIECEPEIAHGIAMNNFEFARGDVVRVAALIEERISVVQGSLDGLDGKLGAVAEELYQLASDGLKLFNRALAKGVPPDAPWVGGKPFMKVSASLTGMSSAERKAIVATYLRTLIDNKLSGKSDLPVNGAHLAARCLLDMTGRTTIGLRLLTMEQNIEHQYRPVGSLKVSDGQGTVIAMFMYLLISQLRSDTQASTSIGWPGPLFLDNPFAKVQTKALVDVQRQVAAAAGVQLIYFTANGDPNILSGFPRMIRLRKSGIQASTGRTLVDYVQGSPSPPPAVPVE